MMRHIFILIFLFGITTLSYSQAQVSVGWGQDTINLGDQVELNLFIQAPPQTVINEVSGGFLDSIISGFQTLKMRQADSTKNDQFEYADIDIDNYGNFSIESDDDIFTQDELKWDRAEMNGNVLLSNKFYMRVWDPGQIIITNPKVKYTYQGQNLISNQAFNASLFVRPPLDVDQMEKDSFDIAPIKTIIEEPIDIKDFYPYFAILGLIIIGALSYILYQKYRSKASPREIVQPEVIIPAHEIALDKLTGLDEKKLWETDIKGYQSELTYIVREYLENRYEIPALESTTDEIVTAIKKKQMEDGHIKDMREILQVADLVKFAKSKPSINIHQEFMDKAFSFVRDTKESEEIIVE